MKIEFHCEHCGKLIRAPKDAGGRHGKCPGCQQRVYVPMPDDELEELAVAPLDEKDERRQRALDIEAQEAKARLLRDKDRAEGAGAASPDPENGAGAAASIDVPALVLQFISAIKDSKLDVAESIVAELKPAAGQARDEVQRLMVDEMIPPGLEGIPAPVYKGFLKSLLDRL